MTPKRVAPKSCNKVVNWGPVGPWELCPLSNGKTKALRKLIRMPKRSFNEYINFSLERVIVPSRDYSFPVGP